MTTREEIKKEADALHEQAQDKGDPDLYDQAAEKYEDARYYNQACKCRLAAMRLRVEPING